MFNPQVCISAFGRHQLRDCRYMNMLHFRFSFGRKSERIHAASSGRHFLSGAPSIASFFGLVASSSMYLSALWWLIGRWASPGHAGLVGLSQTTQHSRAFSASSLGIARGHPSLSSQSISTLYSLRFTSVLGFLCTLVSCSIGKGGSVGLRATVWISGRCARPEQTVIDYRN